MADHTYNVLLICTGNSARSIMAECILNRLGQGRFRAFSAGSHPSGKVNPNALTLLERFNYPTAGLRSKDWAEFTGEGAPDMDFVFTVCDNAAGEVCPVWPGRHRRIGAFRTPRLSRERKPRRPPSSPRSMGRSNGCCPTS